MKIFVFERISHVSGSYHHGGGLVIIAKDIDGAKELIKNDKDIQLSESEWDSVEIFELKDENTKPKYWVFPDAGCC